jgi:glycosyltransferase involved in cell wall biosynthesis
MKKKKILHFISGLEVGGTETQLLRILPNLQNYHDNRVCCANGRGPIGKALEEKGISVYYLDLENIFNIFAIKRFYKIVKDFSPDILVTYLIHADLYGRILGKLFGIKKIICSKRGALLQWEWLFFFDRMTKKMVDHYLVQTETAKKEWIEKLKLPESKFTVIPNGIDIKQFKIQVDKTKKKEELGIKKDSFIITCVSKLRRGKGHKLLLEVFENIFESNKNISLLLVGDGEQEKSLREQVKNYHSKNEIFFLGFRKDIAEILSVSDLFVLPTEKEGMSNAIIEAMIMGVPVITTNIPENKDIIENQKTGIFFTVNDVNSLKKSVETLIYNPDLRTKLGQNAQQEVTLNFDIQVVTKRFANFYQEV